MLKTTTLQLFSTRPRCIAGAGAPIRDGGIAMSGLRFASRMHPVATVLATAVLLGFSVPSAVDAQTPQAHQTEARANKGAKRILIQTRDTGHSFTGTSFRQVTGGTITIPSAQRGYLVATFQAESQCLGGTYCSVRIVCDGTELLPAAGTQFAFDFAGDDRVESHSVTRHSNVLSGGSHFCEVQTAQVGGSSLRLDDWIFLVEYWRKR